MAFKTQSRKRNRSMTNLLDASMGSTNLAKSGQTSPNYPQFQTNSMEFDNDPFTDNNEPVLTKSPTKKKNFKKRIFS